MLAVQRPTRTEKERPALGRSTPDSRSPPNGLGQRALGRATYLPNWDMHRLIFTLTCRDPDRLRRLRLCRIGNPTNLNEAIIKRTGHHPGFTQSLIWGLMCCWIRASRVLGVVARHHISSVRTMNRYVRTSLAHGSVLLMIPQSAYPRRQVDGAGLGLAHKLVTPQVHGVGAYCRVLT